MRERANRWLRSAVSSARTMGAASSGHLAQRVAGQVRSRILVGRSLGRGGPAAEIDPLDPCALQRHRLPRRVGAERRDLLPTREELAQPVVELLRRDAGHRVVRLDPAPLVDRLAGGIEPRDAGEARVGEEGRGLRDLGVPGAGGGRGLDGGLDQRHRGLSLSRRGKTRVARPGLRTRAASGSPSAHARCTATRRGARRPGSATLRSARRPAASAGRTSRRPARPPPPRR